MRIIKTTKFWIYFLVAVLLLSSFAMIFFGSTAGGDIAVISVDGEVVKEINLSEVTSPYTFRLDVSDTQYNILRVDTGEISVIEASCPDHVCVHKGTICDSSSPIVCLPNKVIIAIHSDSVTDAVDSVVG